MYYRIKVIYSVIALTLLTACGSYFNQPVSQQHARVGEVTQMSKKLKELPLPVEPIVVGVYNFKDQTGQYKNIEVGSTFSTAVSQGATTMLIKALEDSKWFTPIERENLGNLLNERNIIRSTRDEYSTGGNPSQSKLPPLLFAGILLEGGIVSYDSNIITGGLGARYFGAGGSTQYRQDRITVYLRAVSTSNGKILKTVYVSKTILSQAVDASLFRYVNFQRLLEVETGYTKNEPVQLALKEAIEKAVEGLIIEGIQDKLWSTKDGEVENNVLVQEYLKDKELEESKLLYNRSQKERSFRNSLYFSGLATLLNGDYSKKRLGNGASIGFSRKLNHYLNLNLGGSYYELEAGDTYSKPFMDMSINAEGVLLPFDKFTPTVYGGIGLMVDLENKSNVNKIDPVPKLQLGVGFMFNVSDRVGIKAFAENNFTFSDELDLVTNGKRDDFFYNFGIGIHYFFGSKKIEKEFNNTDLIQE